MLTLDCAVPFDAQYAAQFIDALPAKAAVVVIEPRRDLPGARPLLLRTANLRLRMRLLLGPRDPDAAARRVHLAGYAEGIRYRLTGSPFEQSLAHYQNARTLWPVEYRKKLRLRSPALIKFTSSNAYPRAFVTRRRTAGGAYFGPFASRRAADSFLESFLDLFHLRRCQIKILRDPSFPGCIYSEMKKCLAPCFAGCTDEEYSNEAARAAAFLSTRGASAVAMLKMEREAASSAMEFERAAVLHRDLERAETACRAIPDIVHTVPELDGVILQKAPEEGTVAVFVVRAARIGDPLLLRFTDLAGQPHSVEEILRATLESRPDGKQVESSSSEVDDHLALLARWFYSRPRQGEVFFAEAGPRGWPYRRMLRACSRILSTETDTRNH
jgi:excinuclease ABC subunit C